MCYPLTHILKKNDICSTKFSIYQYVVDQYSSIHRILRICVRTHALNLVMHLVQLYQYAKFCWNARIMRSWCRGQDAVLQYLQRPSTPAARVRTRTRVQKLFFDTDVLEYNISSVDSIFFPLVTFCFWKLLVVNLLSFYPVQSADHLSSNTSTPQISSGLNKKY